MSLENVPYQTSLTSRCGWQYLSGALPEYVELELQLVLRAVLEYLDITC